jgi:hypothetical protein
MDLSGLIPYGQMPRAIRRKPKLVLIGIGPAALYEAAMFLGPQPLFASRFRGPGWHAGFWWAERSAQEILQFAQGLPSIFELASVGIRLDK